MIIKNEIPILEYDNSSPEVIKPNSGCEELKLPEKCVFAFLGDCVDEFAVKSNAKIAEEFENCCRITNIYVTEYHNQEICLVRPNIGASAATQLLDMLIACGCKKIIATGSCGVLTDIKENALEKTRCLYNLVGDEYICIGDDSGISIDALDGFPGVHTARWMDADDHTKNINLLKKMEGQANRTCHYTTVIAIVGNNIEKTFEYTLDGNLTTEVRGCNGFGFDEIFELNSGKTLAEITTEEKFSVSPRNKALEKLKEYIQSNQI